MKLIIDIIIIVLFGVFLLWTWNNLKDFEEKKEKVIFLAIGITALFVITYIIFSISKIGIEYPNKEIIKPVRLITLLIFLPINGFLSLPHIASIVSLINSGENDEKVKKRIIILSCIWLIVFVIEIIYFKGFQKGIIHMLNKK